MKQKFYSLFLVTMLTTTFVHARVWRVNNTPGVQANFSTAAAAVTAAAAGDTIYLEGSLTQYSFTVNKRLVIIGPGYLLSGSGANTGLQANPNPATVYITIDSLASGSEFLGLSGTFNPSNGADNISVIRCYTYISTFSAGAYANWKILQCYINGFILGYPILNWEFTNNIVVASIDMSTGQNCLVRNNTFRYGITVNSAYFSNNILLGPFTSINSSVKYNIATGNNVLPAGSNNQNGISQNTILVSSGSTDGFYRLAAGSPAIAAGEPINGETPDIGAFGTATPYRLSGIPPIPTIYALSVPASVPANAVSIDVSFSTRSNN